MPRKQKVRPSGGVNYKESYYRVPEDEIQELISRAQNKDSRAQAELLEIFSNFLTKYTTMLYYLKYNVTDYDIRRFIALFIKEPYVRLKLLRNKLDPIAAKAVYEEMRGIHYMVVRWGDIEDVSQTVKTAFLQVVSIYKRKGSIPFSGFLYSYFFYVLKKYVDTFLIDQLGRKTFPLLDNENSDGDDEDGEGITPGFAAPPTPGADELIFSEDIDFDWVCGDTCHYPFDQLSVQERQILKWKYVDGQRASEIAAKVTEHSNTSREHLAKVKEKLNDILKDDLDWFLK